MNACFVIYILFLLLKSDFKPSFSCFSSKDSHWTKTKMALLSLRRVQGKGYHKNTPGGRHPVNKHGAYKLMEIWPVCMAGGGSEGGVCPGAPTEELCKYSLGPQRYDPGARILDVR